MATEIEHKYLINKALWETITPHKSVKITQGYLSTDPNKTLRVRIKGNEGYITIKSKTIGASRLEFEYEIPLADATEMLNSFCTDVIDKTRHLVMHDNKLWEVDEFTGLNQGLVVAEIELNNEAETYSLPIWVTENITSDRRYANSNLIANPYSTWVTMLKENL